MKADICGRIETGKYTNKDGQTVYTTDVIVENIEFGESKKSAEGGSVAPAPTQSQPRRQQQPDVNIPSNIDEELPFN